MWLGWIPPFPLSLGAQFALLDLFSRDMALVDDAEHVLLDARAG